MVLLTHLKEYLLAFYSFFLNLLLSAVLYKSIKIYIANHLPVGILYLKKRKTLFPHPIGIVIGKKVKIGKSCIIYQNVTIGTKETKDFLKADYPTIGNNVTIFANSVIFGNIVIGDNAIIGANSVVFKDIPKNAIVAGNPAKILSYKSE